MVGDQILYTSSFFGDELWPADKLGFTKTAIQAKPDSVYFVVSRGAEVDVKRLTKRPAPPRFGRKLTEAQKARATHICLDCGYIYTFQKPFKEQSDSYLCPQCRALKRRFARYDVDTGKPIGESLPPIRGIVGVVGAALFLFQQLAGTNAVVYYSISVFQSAGVAYDVAASALVGAANVLGTATASLFMGKQGRKRLLITSSKHFASGAWQAVGSALTGSPKFIHKLEHSDVNLADSLQHGGGDADDQFYEDMTFDKCLYIYGGPKQLQELRSFYEGWLKAVQRLQNVVWREFLWGGHYWDLW